MALVPSKRWTAKDVLSVVRELTKTVDQQKILTEQGKFFYKTALSEIVALLNGSLDPNYFTSEDIATAADITHYYSAQEMGGVITDITASTNTITMLGGGISPGVLLHCETHDTSGVSSQRWSGRVVSSTLISNSPVTYNVVYSIITGTDADWTYNLGDWCNIFAQASYQLMSFDISNLAYSADQIATIVDSINGVCVYTPLSVFHSVSRGTFQHKSYDDDIIWTQSGNKIYFRNGGKITSVGTKTIYYQRQPEYPVSFNDSEYVDLADKWVPLLVKRVYTLIILQTENDIPKNLANEMALDYQAIAAYANAEISNRMKPVQSNEQSSRR